jgi:uncharacterized protein (TIGR02246 family)
MHMRTAGFIAIALLTTCVQLAAADAKAGISNELAVQLQAWNRGDIPAFVETYASNCTFVGKQILHGRSQLLARYRNSYASPAAMGKLSFNNLDVQQLDDTIAIATGNWHIDRPASAGGPVGGVFSLVWQLRNRNWRIVLDHSTQNEK